MKIAFTDKEKDLVTITLLRAFADTEISEQADRVIEVANLLGLDIVAQTMIDNNRFSKISV